MTAAPAHGARFELAHDHGAGGRYAITVYAPDATFRARAELDAGVTLAWDVEPPRWVHDTTLGLLRTLLKNHAEDGAWPPRLTRWRTERG